MRILFITPYPKGVAPSQRFRFEQYYNILEKNGYTCITSSFLDNKAWNILYKHGHTFDKILALLRGYLQRINDLIRMHRFDIVFIHREASPFGPPWIEYLITKVFKKYTIYDFDDAIWIPNASETNKNLTMLFKRFKNADDICSWSTVVSVGNAYLADYAEAFNKNVVINPTTIDTNEHHNTVKQHNNEKFVIGWTGSHSTVQYLDELYPVFKKLEEKYDFELHVICDVPPKFELKSLRFIKWTKENEISDLLKFNAGLMPLPADIWAKGKCGFKALQYMALGIPALVSDVGVNAEIVDHEINGFICRKESDWYDALEKLICNPVFLQKLSMHTREKIVNRYSVFSNKNNFLSLFEPAINHPENNKSYARY
jgi:glycosyltransferase involved in cell wall biosynthesis